MSDQTGGPGPGPGWWRASDGRWFPPESVAPTVAQPVAGEPPTQYLPSVAPGGPPPPIGPPNPWDRFRSTPPWVQALAWAGGFILLVVVIVALFGIGNKQVGTTPATTTSTSAASTTTIPVVIPPTSIAVTTTRTVPPTTTPPTTTPPTTVPPTTVAPTTTPPTSLPTSTP